MTEISKKMLTAKMLTAKMLTGCNSSERIMQCV
jgi:hypothetical protein